MEARTDWWTRTTTTKTWETATRRHPKTASSAAAAAHHHCRRKRLLWCWSAVAFHIRTCAHRQSSLTSNRRSTRTPDGDRATESRESSETKMPNKYPRYYYCPTRLENESLKFFFFDFYRRDVCVCVTIPRSDCYAGSPLRTCKRFPNSYKKKKLNCIQP